MLANSRALLPGLLCAAFAVLFLHTAWVKSPTWDEVGHIGLGGYLLKTGRWDVPASCSHPPLAFYLHSPPSFLYPLDWDHFRYNAHVVRDNAFLRMADTRRGNALLLDPRYDGEHLFFWSRATSLLLAAPLFWALYRCSREISGRAGALLSLFGAALSPNLLAHATLINTDFALSATFFGAVFCFRRLFVQPSRTALLTASIALGLALLSKLTALVLLPGLLVAAGWFYRYGQTSQRRAMGELFGLGERAGVVAAYAAVCGMAFLTLWAGYGFRVEPYILTIRSQLWDLDTGHTAYLLGKFSDQGWWYYFPLAILIKTPLPILALAAWGLTRLLRHPGPGGTAELGMLLWPPLILLAVFVCGNAKNIGLRYLLAIYPFLFVLVGAAVPNALRSWQAYLVGGLIVWYAIGAARIHPDHLAHFNEAVGGPELGYHYLVDSNLDWGQDLKGLKTYMDERGIQRIKLSYFGAVDPRLYDLDYEWLPSFDLPNPGQRPAVLPTTGTIAISATNLVGTYMHSYGHGHDLFAWLRTHEPVAQIGHSILVYEIE